jgi:hypothetical protein
MVSKTKKRMMKYQEMETHIQQSFGSMIVEQVEDGI